MRCDRLSRFSRVASFAALVLTLVGACAQSVEDTDPLFGDGGAAAGADAGSHPIPSRDGGTSTPDTSTGGADASTPPAPDAASSPDTGGGTDPVDSGGGGPVSGDCPTSPIYAIEGLAELAAPSPRLCSSGCAATECCYGTLVCVNL